MPQRRLLSVSSGALLFWAPGKELTLRLYSRVHVINRLEVLVCDIHALIAKGDRNNAACKVKDVDCGRVAIILELVVSHSSCRSDWSDDCVQLFAVLGFKGTNSIQVFHLISPLLLLQLPGLIDVCLWKFGAKKIGEIGNGRLS